MAPMLPGPRPPVARPPPGPDSKMLPPPGGGGRPPSCYPRPCGAWQLPPGRSRCYRCAPGGRLCAAARPGLVTACPVLVDRPEGERELLRVRRDAAGQGVQVRQLELVDRLLGAGVNLQRQRV